MKVSEFYYNVEDNFNRLLKKSNSKFTSRMTCSVDGKEVAFYDRSAKISNLSAFLELIGYKHPVTDDNMEKCCDDIWKYLQENAYKEDFWLL